METNRFVTCDFDGTIADQDVCDLILENFGRADWREVGARHDKGELIHREMNQLFVEGLRGKPEELTQLVHESVSISEGFHEFIEACRGWEVQPIIISGGWDLYIKRALSDLNLNFPGSIDELLSAPPGSIPVVCNRIKFCPETGLWTFESPWDDASHCTPDKQKILRQLRQKGARHIVAVGDSSTDRGMAASADWVFAKKGLARYCREEGIEATPYDTFRDIHRELERVRQASKAVLSLPSYHPYMRRLDDGWHIRFVNPDEDTFAQPATCTPENLEAQYPPDSYEVVHIHFEYDLIPSKQLQELLDYFTQKGKRILWTCHDRKSLREDGEGKEAEKSLYAAADQVLTLTGSCKQWLEINLGKHTKEIEVIPHGYIVHPDVVTEELEGITKERNLFTLHVGDFRKSKEYLESIKNFLACPGLEDAVLQVIYRPVQLYPDDLAVLASIQEFTKLIEHPRVRTIAMEPIPDEVLTRAFLTSHAVILPYKWGTHSGQLELARDTGCHVVATNVGYYREQDPATLLCTDLEGSYKEALREAYQRNPLTPLGSQRTAEWREIAKHHQYLYTASKDGV